MLNAIAPASTWAIILLGLCLVLVLVFEFSNGFHDTANAVATVIYTHSLDAVPAVIWSGLLNFLGVMLGGIAVAYTLVDLIPPDVLTPPDGNPAIAMLLSLFLAALIWNVGTWLVGIPCSSSHATIGAIMGVALANSVTSRHQLGQGVDWGQIWSVGKALLFSPLIGFVAAAVLFKLVSWFLHDRALFEPPADGKRPAWWVRGLLILTCGGVSFAHGSNDGQKSIGLIMLTVIGLLPLQFALNPDIEPGKVAAVAQAAQAAVPIIQQGGDDQKDTAVEAARRLDASLSGKGSINDVAPDQRRSVRGDIYRVDGELKLVADNAKLSADDKKRIEGLRSQLKPSVEYAPLWVRLLSALCLGVGTMVGYKRIVRTIGERIGKTHMSPAQGGSAELVGAALIATAGFHGLPVSTTHIVSAGVAGTMASAGSGVQGGTVWQIIAAWVFTLPATILLSGLLFMLLH